MSDAVRPLLVVLLLLAPLALGSKAPTKSPLEVEKPGIKMMRSLRRGSIPRSCLPSRTQMTSATRKMALLSGSMEPSDGELGDTVLLGLALIADQVAQFLVALLYVNRAAEPLIQVSGHPPDLFQKSYISHKKAPAKPRKAVKSDTCAAGFTRPRNKYRISFQPPDSLARYSYFPSRRLSYRDGFHLRPLLKLFGCIGRAICWHSFRIDRTFANWGNPCLL